MKNPTLTFLFRLLDETITEAEKDANPYLMASALAQTNAIGDVIACFRDRWEALDKDPLDDSVDEAVDEKPAQKPDEGTQSYQQAIAAKDDDEELDHAYVIAELKRLGLSQVEIANRVGISEQSVSSYKCGRGVSKKAIRAIENLLQIERVKRGQCE